MMCVWNNISINFDILEITVKNILVYEIFDKEN